MNLLAGGKVGFAATPINPLDSIFPKKRQPKEEKIISNSRIKLKKRKEKKKQTAIIPQVSKRLNFVLFLMFQPMAVSNRALKYLLVPDLEQ